MEKNITTQKKFQVVVFDIDSQGKVAQQFTESTQETTLENTILPLLYPEIKVAMVKVPMGFLDGFEESKVANAMARIECNGTVYMPVGSSSSAAKEGTFYLVDAAHATVIGERLQFWPEGAMHSFGILVSPCRALIETPDLTVLVVKDGQFGTNDCRGWIKRSVFNQLQQKHDEELLSNRVARLWKEIYPAASPQDMDEEIGLNLIEDAKQEIASKRLSSHCLYQFRMSFENAQAKGCFKIIEDDVAELLGSDIILPASSIKPELLIPKNLKGLFEKEGRKFRGRVVVGIRDVSEQRPYATSYQLVENAPDDSIQLEFLPESLRQVRKFKSAVTAGDYTQLLELLCQEDAEVIQDKEELRMVEAALRADDKGRIGISRFPYINNQINKMLARWAWRAATGGGLRLPGFMLADDGYLFAHQGRIYSGSDWIPENKAMAAVDCGRGLCVRYPIRSVDDLLPLEHMQSAEALLLLSERLEREGCESPALIAEQILSKQLWLKGVYGLHSKTASKNGGDYDGDGVCVVGADRFYRFVNYCFERSSEAVHEEKKKVKSRTPWFNLPVVAMKARGSQIGRITDLKTSCLAAGDNAAARQLVTQLQLALDSLKWNVQPDREVIDRISKQVKHAPWLEYKRATAVSQLPKHVPAQDADRIGKIYNILREEMPDLTESKANISEFKMLVAGEEITRAMYEECRYVNSVFAAVVARASERQERHQAECEKASSDLEEAKLDANRMLRSQKYEAVKQAHNLRRLGDERRKKEMKGINTWVRLWAAAPERQEKRMAWVQAMLTVVCEGRGNGAILLTAFPQEFVDRLGELNGTKAARVIVPDLAGYASHVDSEGRAFLTEPIEGGTKKTFLFRKGRNGEIFLGTME